MNIDINKYLYYGYDFNSYDLGWVTDCISSTRNQFDYTPEEAKEEVLYNLL